MFSSARCDRMNGLFTHYFIKRRGGQAASPLTPPPPPLMLTPKLEEIYFLLFIAVATEATGSRGTRNVTIDDQFGDEITHIAPTYSPSAGKAWMLGGTGGLARPNASLAYSETWHDSTHQVGDATRVVNFSFTGVALYVYCIIANTPPGPYMDAFADYKFFIEEDLVGIYRHDVEKIPDYFFNVPVYVNTSIENKEHNFSIVVDSTQKTVLLLFDYALYTMIEVDSVDTSTSGGASVGSPTQHTPEVVHVPEHSGDSRVGVIIGTTFGVLSLIALIATLIRHRYQKARMASSQTSIQQWRFSGSNFFARSQFCSTANPFTRRQKDARLPILSNGSGSSGGDTGGRIDGRRQPSLVWDQRHPSMMSELDMLPPYISQQDYILE